MIVTRAQRKWEEAKTSTRPPLELHITSCWDQLSGRNLIKFGFEGASGGSTDSD